MCLSVEETEECLSEERLLVLQSFCSKVLKAMHCAPFTRCFKQRSSVEALPPASPTLVVLVLVPIGCERRSDELDGFALEQGCFYRLQERGSVKPSGSDPFRLTSAATRYTRPYSPPTPTAQAQTYSSPAYGTARPPQSSSGPRERARSIRGRVGECGRGYWGGL